MKRRSRKTQRLADMENEQLFLDGHEAVYNTNDFAASAKKICDINIRFLQSVSNRRVENQFDIIANDIHEISRIDPDGACQVYAMLAQRKEIGNEQELDELETVVLKSWLQGANSKRIYETWSSLVYAFNGDQESLKSKVCSIALGDVNRVTSAFFSTAYREAAERPHSHKPFGQSLDSLISILGTERQAHHRERNSFEPENKGPFYPENNGRSGRSSEPYLGIRCLPPNMPPR